MPTDQPFVFESTYRLHYNTPQPVPLRLVIESLQGLEKLIETTPRVLKRLTGVDDLNIRIEVEEVRSGSLTEKVIVRCIFGSEERLHQFLDRVRAVIPPHLLATAVLAGLVGYGAYMLHNPTATSAVTVGDITNSVVSIGGTQSIPSEVAAAIVDGVTNKKEVASAAINIVKPAKEQPGSSLRLDGGVVEGVESTYEFSPAFIDRMPREMPNQPLESTTRLENVVVEIRATDLDSREHGWEGRIEGLTSRIKIEFDRGIDIEDADRRKRFRADVILTSRHRGADPQPRPHSMLIESIHPVGQDAAGRSSPGG